MTDRIIDISENGVYLHVRGTLLVIEKNEEETTVPMQEIGAVVVSNPRVTYTQSVLTGLADAGASFITCDEKYMPASMMLPLNSHFIQAERFQLQAGASQPLRKRLWKDIIRAKIKSQAWVLMQHRSHDAGLGKLVVRVKSGDKNNVEARTAKRYWAALFQDPEFRRDRYAPDQNSLLNYGYAVLRAIVSRAICAAGLHPSLGLHHHNRYDSFRLASDLMEPFRAMVDNVVVQIYDAAGEGIALDKYTKTALLESLTGRVEIDGRNRTLFDASSRCASSLVAVFSGERDNLVLPEFRL